MTDIRLSVVIPAWNAAATLPQTLDTVLGQGAPGVEVLVVDDGSTDATPQVLAELAARHGDALRWRRIDNSGGPARPRNVGLEMARGELVALFDSDDLMEPGKLGAQLAVFDAHPHATLCFTDFMVIDEAGAVLQPSMLADYTSFREHLQPAAGNPDAPPVAIFQGADLHRALIHANFVGTSSVTARRDALLAAGGFDATLGNGDDLDMWLKLARDGAVFAFLDVIGHRYRKTAGGVTARGWRRLPAVAEVRRRQIPFVQDAETRAFLDDVIHGCKLGEAWGLRKEGRAREAAAAYSEALAMRASWEGRKGLWLSRLLSLLGR
ncbi:MAG TPA: glycosyltransferase family 2 protein, partial [Candidatus Krumholzibacteria bacterium]|nr:glycosyltransferase family 2 protein [Candidatus Krumholzibacteria bacterium]HRX51533.1 glycosyltransferase family 2 protein [Candidatus Krumholzibacteria bacterium]